MYTKIFITWDASSFLGNLKQLYGWLWRTPCYIFTISFSGSHYRLGKHTQLTSKPCENVAKIKKGVSAFFLLSLKVNSYESFSSRFYLFLCFVSLFWDEGINLYDFDSAFYHFSRYYYRHDVKWTQYFFCFTSGILTEHRFENLHGFHSYKFYNDK